MTDFRLFGCILTITFCFQGIRSQSPNSQGLDCSDIWQKNKNSSSGVYIIEPDGANVSFSVYCEMKACGGWTLIQRRNGLDGVMFNQLWSVFEEGFGNVTGEHWLGLEKMSILTHQTNRKCKLNIFLEDFSSPTQSAYAQYSTFSIGPSSGFYQLFVGNYTGTAGDSFTGSYNQNGSAFSTTDAPHDSCTPTCFISDMVFKSCSAYVDSGWWFNVCELTNLNGHYHTPPNHMHQASFLSWPTWRFYESLKSTKMSVNCK